MLSQQSVSGNVPPMLPPAIAPFPPSPMPYAPQHERRHQRTPRPTFPALRYDPCHEQIHNTIVGENICPGCHGRACTDDLQTCTTCGGVGDLIGPAMLAHRLLSAPLRADRKGGGFTLPLLTHADTSDPYWLANLVANATNDEGEPLTPDQLITVMDFGAFFQESYQSDAVWWPLFFAKVISLIGERLREWLPEGLR